jgi:hypothetical protein
MPRFWINPTLDRARGGALVALCDRCAAEPETARAVREQGWKEISRSHPRAREGRVVLRGVRGAVGRRAPRPGTRWKDAGCITG